MQPPAIAPLVYHRLYPRPQPNDPVDFNQFVAKCIVPEVRQETLRFYGPDNSLESSYPGIDYASKGARTRLRLYTYHRRLFRAFDELRLSAAEIHALCKWEGTKYSKDRYERENRTRIRDTTWDGVKTDLRPILPVKSVSMRSPVPRLRGGSRTRSKDVDMGAADDNLLHLGEDTDDEIFESSVGTALNQRLINATAARARGEPAVLDSAWEQWMKDVTERGVMYPPGYSVPAVPISATVPLLPNTQYQTHPYFTSRIQAPTSYHPSGPGMSSYYHRSSNSPLTSSRPASLEHVSMAPPRLLPSPRHRIGRSSNPRSSASSAS